MNQAINPDRPGTGFDCRRADAWHCAAFAGGSNGAIVPTEAGKNVLRDALPSWRVAQAQAQAVLGK